MMGKTNLTNYKSLTTSSGIYHILNNQNGNFYVGSAKNLRKRIRDHCKGEKSNPHLQNAINKYGIESFTVRVEIYDTLTYDELLAVEQEYLDKYFEECWDRTYNISDLASGFDINCLSEERQIEIRQKKSEAMKGENHPLFGKNGQNHPMFGKQLSEETKQKISVAKKGKQLSDETKQKLSEAMKGRQLSDDHKQKISEANKGENSPMFGKQLSEETKQKISVANRGKEHTEDHKQKISETMKGRQFSDEHKQKLSEAKYRRKVQKGIRVITDNFCCYCPKDAQKELKIDRLKFHKLYKINEDTGYYDKTNP